MKVENSIISTCRVVVFLFWGLILLSDFLWNSLPYLNQIKTTICIMVLLFFLVGIRIFILNNKLKTFQITYIDILSTIFVVIFIIHLSNEQKPLIYETITLILWYFYCRQISKRDTYLYCYIFILVAIAQIIIGACFFTEPWQDNSYIRGVFTNSSLMGGYLAITAIILINFILFKQNSIEKKVLRFFCKILNSIFLSIILYQLFISNSRAGWLAFVVSFIYIVLYAVKNRIGKTLSPWMKRCSIIIFIAVSFLFITHLYVLKKDSSDGRLLIWKISLEMILDRPFAGYGLNGFKENYMLYQSKYFQKNIEDKYAILAGNNLYPFNEFIHLIIKFGIFIILLLGGSIYSLFFYQNKIMNTEMRIFRSIILAWIIFSCFSYPNQFVHFSFLFIFIVARIAANHPNIGSASIYNCISFIKNSYCAAYLYVLCSVISIYSADAYWKNINILEDVLVKKDDVFTLEKCEVLYPFFKNDDYFLFQYGTLLIKNEKYEQAIKILEQASILRPNYSTNILLGGAYEKCTNIKRMKEYWEEAHYMIPSKFQPLYGLMNAYIRIGNLSQAQFYATLIVDKEEKIISPLSYRMKKEAQIILNEIN